MLTIRHLYICMSQENCAVLWVSVQHSPCLATNYYFSSCPWVCLLSLNFLFRNSLLPVNPQPPYNSLFLQSCLADCL